MNSDKIKQGPSGAPVRSLFYGMGYVKEELDRPLIGVVNAQNELIPGHMLLDRVAQAVKRGILLAGGTPLGFPPSASATASLWDTDGHEIPAGQPGADLPTAWRPWPWRAISSRRPRVPVPNCDKIVPGMVTTAAARLEHPCRVLDGIRRSDDAAGHRRRCGHLSDSNMYHGEPSAPLETADIDRGCGTWRRTRQRCLPGLRFLFRSLYGQQHELSDRGCRHGSSVQRNSPLRQRRENPSGEESRHPSYGNAEKRYPSPRYSHKRSL